MRDLSRLMNLSGRKALVTGGAGHIGLAAGEALVELGASVSILDRDENACRERVETLCALREDSAVSAPCDLRDEEATRKCVRSTIADLGGLDIIVHCAAYVGTTEMPGWVVPFEEQTVEAWDAAMSVNLTSAFVIAQEARKAMSASGRGSIIFFISHFGLVGPDLRLYQGTSMGSPAAYAASKGGLLQLTRWMATVLAPEIRVNGITPGGVWRDQPEIFQERYVSNTPLRRMATEEDLKGAVAYLSSDLSAYVTGQNLVVDGGWTVW